MKAFYGGGILLGILQLTYILAIIENQYSITKAANQIHITQSALSQFINNYENTSGQTIFVRGSNNRLEGLTEYGELLYKHAQHILDDWQSMENELENFGKEQKLILSFGMTGSYIRMLFPKLFMNLSQEFNNIRLELVDKPMPAVEKDFYDGKLDYAVLVGPLTSKTTEMEIIHIGKDELCAFISKSHPLADKILLDWTDLINFQIISLPENYYTHKRIINYLKKYQLSVDIISPSTIWEHLMASAHETDAVTILPGANPEMIINSNIIVKKFKDPASFDMYIGRKLSNQHPVLSEKVKQYILTQLII